MMLLDCKTSQHVLTVLLKISSKNTEKELCARNQNEGVKDISKMHHINGKDSRACLGPTIQFTSCVILGKLLSVLGHRNNFIPIS